MTDKIEAGGRVLSGLRNDRGALATILGCALLITLVWLGALERASHERQEARLRAFTQTENLALAFEEQILRVVANADQVLRILGSREQGYAGLGLRSEVRASVLADPAFANVALIDRDGRVVASVEEYVEANVGDRDYFRYHRDRADGGLFIGRPVKGRIVPRTVIHFARRIEDARGAFNGVAVASIDAAYFTNFYRRVALGQHGLVQLVGLDGIALARRQGEQTIFGSDMGASSVLRHAAERESGSFVSAGRLDGYVRQQSFRVLKDYGLVVSVGMTIDEVFAEVYERERDLYAFAALATLCLLILGSVLVVSRGRLLEQLDELRRFQRATVDRELRMIELKAELRAMRPTVHA